MQQPGVVYYEVQVPQRGCDQLTPRKIFLVKRWQECFDFYDRLAKEFGKHPGWPSELTLPRKMKSAGQDPQRVAKRQRQLDKFFAGVAAWATASNVDLRQSLSCQEFCSPIDTFPESMAATSDAGTRIDTRRITGRAPLPSNEVQNGQRTRQLGIQNVLSSLHVCIPIAAAPAGVVVSSPVTRRPREAAYSKQDSTLGHSVYHILVTPKRGVPWRLSRRYSDFAELHSAIFDEVGTAELQLPPFPPTQWFNRTSTVLVQQRRTALQDYLQCLLQLFAGACDSEILPVRCYELVASFVQCPDTVVAETESVRGVDMHGMDREWKPAGTVAQGIKHAEALFPRATAVEPQPTKPLCPISPSSRAASEESRTCGMWPA